MINNKIRSFGGNRNIYNLTNGDKPGHMVYAPSPTAQFWVILGDDNAVVYDGATITEIDTFATVDEALWTSTNLGGIPIFNNPGMAPQYWLPQQTNQPLQDLIWEGAETWEDKAYRCRSMRSFGSYLIALGMTEGVDYPQLIRWSHPALIGEVPTKWETGADSLAGRVPLGGSGGNIIDGFALRNAFAIYREAGVVMMQYTNDDFVFDLEYLTDSVNIATTNCIAEVKGSHFIMAAGDIVVNDGNRIQSIMHNRLRSRYSAVFNEDEANKAFAVHNTLNKEVWFFVPTVDAVHPTEAWCYNYKDDTWSIHDVDTPASADYGLISLPERTWATWEGTWGQQQDEWGRRAELPFNGTLYGVKQGSPPEIITLDDFISQSNYVTRVERTDIPFTSMQDVVTVQRIYPHIQGKSTVNISLGYQEHAGGAVRWKAPIPFQPGVDRKIDIRVTGELLAIKFETEGNQQWELAGVDIEWVPAGFR